MMNLFYLKINLFVRCVVYLHTLFLFDKEEK
mgnify:CR=1 FL=1